MATLPIPTSSGQLISPQAQAEQIEELLQVEKAAQKISSILDLDELIDKIVSEIAESFRGLEANIYLHDEVHRELVLTGVCGCTVYTKGDRKKVGKEGIVGHVAATGRMHYAPDVRIDPYYIPCEPSTRSEVAFPLEVERQLVGVFSISHHQLDAFPACQLRLLEGLSRHIAVAIRNARRYGEERQERERMTREAREARAIQQALLPKASPYIPGFAISGLSVPAGDVGGDWYDFIPFEDGSWGLVLADVSGKGTAAALLMSATRGMLRSLADRGASPREVLGKLNRLMVEDFPPGRFVTLVYGVLDPGHRKFTFASAGHLPPLLVRDGEAQFLHSEQGTPLGLVAAEFSERTVELPPGSRLLFYSDGITEASGPAKEEYGAQRLEDYLLEPEASTQSLLDEVRRYANGAGFNDDATVILVRA